MVQEHVFIKEIGSTHKWPKDELIKLYDSLDFTIP
jgi:hypothetical protein